MKPEFKKIVDADVRDTIELMDKLGKDKVIFANTNNELFGLLLIYVADTKMRIKQKEHHTED